MCVPPIPALPQPRARADYDCPHMDVMEQSLKQCGSMQGGPTPRDEELVRWLRRKTQASLLLVANKCERKSRPGDYYLRLAFRAGRIYQASSCFRVSSLCGQLCQTNSMHPRVKGGCTSLEGQGLCRQAGHSAAFTIC